MMRLPARTARLVLVLCLAALVVAPAAPAAGQTDERITSYRIDIEILRPSGDLRISEVINYNFGANERHGIFRYIPVRFTYDERFDRIYPVEVESVTASPGTPSEYEETTEGQNFALRIGDPDETISGLRQYRIVYRLRGALNGFEDHDELYWNAIGFGWEVPIENVNVTVVAPAEVTEVACFAGPEGSNLPCADARKDGPEAHFSHPLLPPGEATTVVVGIPRGVVDAPAPILDERWSFGRAFRATPFTVAGALTILVLLGALLYHQVFKKGRDRRFAGSPVDAAMGSGGPEEPVGLLERTPIPVEFQPPEDLRPGQVGTLVDQQAHTLDVIATIIDLAVRGYLRIEEVPKEGWFGRADWRMLKLKDADGLKSYEEQLLHAIFSGGKEEVLLSDLKDRFAAKLKEVQNALYKDVVDQGWFASRPDRVRETWRWIGVGVLVAGAGFLVAVAAFTEFGLMALPFPLAGLLILIFADKMPSRTAKGTAVARRVNGFRKFIEESEADRARFAERKNLFSEYLPYAVVFGATKKWAKAFEEIDGQLPATAWYVGSSGEPFSASSFSDSIGGFTVNTAGTITSTPSSSGGSGFSGGSSGGGGGGGGGGSW
ncbi:MAG TPA: DUF2207 domain-containing protein [Actinomycetota bacterium]|nr:DUF2207 domain-containing protein [Actinomycetota bacterium]